MAIYLPGNRRRTRARAGRADSARNRRGTGQVRRRPEAAKRAVAIALRNRMRRQKLPPELAEEIMPKNIIMIGPTGVGKTEIARRLAKLANSPFLKVEASKFTEVGYVGRDVESMIRDLVEIAIDMVREEKLEEVADKAELNAEERLLDCCCLPSPAAAPARRRRRLCAGRQLAADSGIATARARSCASNCAKASWTTAWSRSTCANATAGVRNHLQPGRRGDGHQPQGHAAQPLRPAHQEAQDEGRARRSNTWSRKKSSA